MAHEHTELMLRAVLRDVMRDVVRECAPSSEVFSDEQCVQTMQCTGAILLVIRRESAGTQQYSVQECSADISSSAARCDASSCNEMFHELGDVQ